MFTVETLIRVGLATGAASLVLCGYLLYRCRKQKAQINRLTSEISMLQNENAILIEKIRDSVKPEFIATGITINDSVNRIDIKLKNEGAPAILEKVVTSTPDIEFLDDRFFPLRIGPDEMFIVTGISKGLPLQQCRYVVQLHFSDLQGNHYLATVRGEGNQFKMTSIIKEAA